MTSEYSQIFNSLQSRLKLKAELLFEQYVDIVSEDPLKVCDHNLWFKDAYTSMVNEETQKFMNEYIEVKSNDTASDRN